MSEYDEQPRLTPEEKAAASQRADGWHEVLSTPGGRRVMWELMTSFGLFGHAIGDIAAGQRMAALHIRDACKDVGDGAGYWKMMFQENEK